MSFTRICSCGRRPLCRFAWYWISFPRFVSLWLLNCMYVTSQCRSYVYLRNNKLTTCSRVLPEKLNRSSVSQEIPCNILEPEGSSPLSQKPLMCPSSKLDQSNSDVLLTMRRSVFISVLNQLDAQNLFHNKFYLMPLRVSSTCAHHHTYRCDDTRGCVIQF